MRTIRETINKLLLEIYNELVPIFGLGWYVYDLNEPISKQHFNTYSEAIQFKKEIERERGLSLGIYDAEKNAQNESNEIIKKNGGIFNINSQWNYSGTSFDGNEFKDKTGHLLTIYLYNEKTKISVKVLDKQKTVGFAHMSFDVSNNLRNIMYISVDEDYRNRGIASAIYDYLTLQGHKVKPSLKGLLDDGIKLWNSNQKYINGLKN